MMPTRYPNPQNDRTIFNESPHDTRSLKIETALRKALLAPKKKKGCAQFIKKLNKLLTLEDYQDVCSFVPDGDSFLILNTTRFVHEIIPQFFQHKSLRSFVRQLHLYGFRKCLAGCQYEHPLFLKNRPELHELISRTMKEVQNHEQNDTNSIANGIPAMVLEREFFHPPQPLQNMTIHHHVSFKKNENLKKQDEKDEDEDDGSNEDFDDEFRDMLSEYLSYSQQSNATSLNSMWEEDVQPVPPPVPKEMGAIKSKKHKVSLERMSTEDETFSRNLSQLQPSSQRKSITRKHNIQIEDETGESIQLSNLTCSSPEKNKQFQNQETNIKQAMRLIMPQGLSSSIKVVPPSLTNMAKHGGMTPSVVNQADMINPFEHNAASGGFMMRSSGIQFNPSSSFSSSSSSTNHVFEQKRLLSIVEANLTKNCVQLRKDISLFCQLNQEAVNSRSSLSSSSLSQELSILIRSLNHSLQELQNTQF